MIVRELELDFFRNYTHLQARFDPKVNLIYGDNAQGKTNLLEAVAYLSAARSHRARYDREMIMLNVDSAFVRGEIESRTGTLLWRPSSSGAGAGSSIPMASGSKQRESWRAS